MFISTATSPDEASRSADVAVLPVGSFEQHGTHLPLSTDTLIACAIALRLADDYDLFLLPPITLSCSHEHAGFAGGVSLTAPTLHAIVSDILRSIEQSGVDKLAIINAHGGNYVLANIVQEANVERRRMVLFPQAREWTDARVASGIVTSNREDMHGGEAETSIMLATYPDAIYGDYANADHLADERRHLLTLGMRGYTESGIIGRPSLATAEKGRALLDSFALQFKDHLSLIR